MISIISAMDENGLIGINNKLPWDLPNDLAHFKRKTVGKDIVMGRTTFESIGILPKRKTHVMSRSWNTNNEEVVVLRSVQDVLELQDKHSENEVMVIGGAEIYELLIPYADKMYITKIDEAFAGDTYFPEVNWDEWEDVATTVHKKEHGHNHDHTIYIYKRK